MNDYASYRDYLRPRGLTWIKATLRVTVAVQCLGAAAQRLSAGTVSPVADFLIHDLNWSEAQAGQLDYLVASGLLVGGILTALRPAWPVLIPITAWFIATTLVPVARELSPAAIFSVMDHALWFLSPLALLILDFWPPTLKSHLGRTVIAMWILRLAVTATFAGLGLLAVMQSVQSGPLLTLLKSVANQFSEGGFSDAAARCCLGASAGLSIALALNVLVTRSKPMLVGTSVWGGIVAFSQMVEWGPSGYPETLVRFGQVGAPVVLFLYFHLSIKEFPAEVIADN